MSILEKLALINVWANSQNVELLNQINNIDVLNNLYQYCYYYDIHFMTDLYNNKKFTYAEFLEHKTEILKRCKINI